MDHKQYKFDHYSKFAQQLGYRSRAALKLIEMHEKMHIFKPGLRVLDLGAAPGSWSQVVAKYLNNTGKIIGVDLLKIEPYKNIEFIQCDMNDFSTTEKFDVVLSDMCPDKTGNVSVDIANIYTLVMQATNLAISQLNERGVFLCKFFHSTKENDLTNFLKQHFQIVKKLKPKASRAQSSEVYLYCKK